MEPPFQPTAARYGIIGDGRMARHMGRYFDLLTLPYVAWSRGMEQNASVSANTVLATCEIILVLISDGAIEPFIQSHQELFRQKTLIHFSGSLLTPLAQGVHPLSSFADEAYDLDTYRTIPFICEGGRSSFAEIFPDLPNPHYTIAPHLKPLYHSMAVMAGNFTTLLWNKLFDTFEEQLHLPPQIAIPYLKQICHNLQHQQVNAQAGPITRGDRQTIQSNLAALTDDPFREVYAAFVNTVTPDLLKGTE